MLPALTSPNTAAGESGNNVETTAGFALQSGGRLPDYAPVRDHRQAP